MKRSCMKDDGMFLMAAHINKTEAKGAISYFKIKLVK